MTEANSTETQAPQTPPGVSPNAPLAATATAVKPTPEAKKRAQVAANAVRKFFARKENFWSELPQMFSQIFSPDLPTRKMAILFMMSFLGFISVLSMGIGRYWKAKKVILIAEAQKRTQRLETLLKKEIEETKRRGSLFTLGNFTLEFKDMPGQKFAVGQVNMAEIEIVLLCDSQDTRDFIESNSVQVRNQLTNALTAFDREEFLSREGKKKLKTLIVRKVNDWLPHGKIEDVYFSKLLMS